MLGFLRSAICGCTALIAAYSCVSPVAAQTSARAVPSVGQLKDIAGAGEKPNPAATYKIVFDVQTSSDSSDDVAPALQTIGALVNTYRGYGVPASHLQLTAVFHGQTILIVTKDDVYARRTGAKANPNASLLRELVAAGVQMVVCGQSALKQNYESSDYLPDVHTNLSATVTFLNLQTRGYVKLTA